MPDADILQRIEELRPWRYRHQVGNITIQSDSTEASTVHESYGRALFTQIVETLLKDRNPGELRALDLGCLEGHYSDILCAAGIGEVVSIDLSPSHVVRAKFLLHELRGYTNSTVIEGNVSDPQLMTSIGTFDIIICSGLLYHLKDPVNLFEYFKTLLSENEHSVILLSTQFKIRYSVLISPNPIAELKIKRLPKLDNNDEGEYLFNPKDHSVFEPYSFRLNPAAVYSLLHNYGYRGLIAYDTPGGISHSFHVDLVVSRSPCPQLLKALQHAEPIEGVRYYEWNGNSVDSYSLNRRIIPRVLRAFNRITNAAANWLS